MTLVEAAPITFQIFVFVFGCCLGSFYNVVIHRLPQKLSLVHPRSRCPSCGNFIAAYDNIPLASYILLGGKCRQCRIPISLRYPIVEALAGLFALLLFRRYGFHPQFGIEFIFISLLLIIAMIDLDTFLIPDVLSLPGIVLGFASSFFSTRLTWSDSLLGIFLGGGLLYLIAAGYAFIRRKEGMGGGDIKLLGMIGAFLGWPGVLFTVLFSSISGLIVAVPLLLRKDKGLGSEIPYGPFLAFGAVCYIFWGQLIFQWYYYQVLGV
ncbi:MAG: A24 family peptidase [Syntrophobacteraceae bacterium]